jgi:hypothetical protein
VLYEYLENLGPGDEDTKKLTALPRSEAGHASIADSLRL